MGPAGWLLLTLATVGAVTAAPSAPCITVNATAPDKLPFNFIPDSYYLNLTLPTPGDSSEFSGAVQIDGSILSASSCLVLNAASTLSVTRATANGMAATSITQNRENETVVLHFNLEAGPVTLDLFFGGIIIEANATGLFLSPNTVTQAPASSIKAAVERFATGRVGRRARSEARRRDRRGASGTQSQHARAVMDARKAGDPMMLATQFEDTSARVMLPCVDEPGYKAYFQATIQVADGLQVLFNTEEISSALDATTGLRAFEFEKTMHRLPVYLLAVAVGNFDFLEQESHGVKYRIVTPVGYKEWGRLALNASIHATEFFGERYNLPYSQMNKKMDSISVAALDMDAMENQGLLTYSSQMLLLNPDPNAPSPGPITDNGRLAQAQLITLVTTHEILHQWFGDTVTMRDWVQEYLNEGFARLMQAYGVTDLVPEWDMICFTGSSQGRTNSLFQFTYEVAMKFDTPGTAPSIVYALPGGGDIPSFPAAAKTIAFGEEDEQDPTKAPLFHRMFYEKGASVNRMVADHVGWDNFDKALGQHLQRFLWQNPTVEDLMRSLNEAFVSKGSPSAMAAMLPWLQRPGYPVVTLSAIATQAGELELSASQVASSKYLPTDRSSEPWWVPVKGEVVIKAKTGVLCASSVEDSFDIEFELTERTATKTFPLSQAVKEALVGGACAASVTVAGNTRFLGPFIVRYDDQALWDARVTAVAMLDKGTPRDYVRETIFHASLLAKMSHEKSALPAAMMTAVGTPLAANPNLGGVTGSYDLYLFLCNTAQYLGHNDATASTIPTAMQILLEPLVARLGWPNQTEQLGSADFTQQEPSAEDVPWPTHEDAGVEARAQADAWPLALYQSVLYGEPGAVAEALRQFRSTANKKALSPISAQAILFAAARHGSDADYASVVSLYSMLAADDSMKQLALTALSTGAAKAARCVTAVGVVGEMGSVSDRISALGGMIELAPVCRDAALDALKADALVAWEALGEGINKNLTSVLSSLCTPAQLKVATELVGSQNSSVLPADVVRTMLTSIEINIDMIAANY